MCVTVTVLYIASAYLAEFTRRNLILQFLIWRNEACFVKLASVGFGVIAIVMFLMRRDLGKIVFYKFSRQSNLKWSWITSSSIFDIGFLIVDFRTTTCIYCYCYFLLSIFELTLSLLLHSALEFNFSMHKWLQTLLFKYN